MSFLAQLHTGAMDVNETKRTKKSTVRRWGKDRGASHMRGVNPKNIKHMCRNSGENRVFQGSLEGNKWGRGCVGRPLEHAVGRGSKAEVETWKTQRMHKLHTRKNAAWVAQGGEW